MASGAPTKKGTLANDALVALVITALKGPQERLSEIFSRAAALRNVGLLEGEYGLHTAIRAALAENLMHENAHADPDKKQE